MELLDLLKQLYAVLTSAEGINKRLGLFVEDEMVKILQALGDVHYNAAIRALRDRKASNVPSREVTSALTILRSAYEEFHAAATKKAFLANWRTSVLRSRRDGYRKACDASLLIAFCY